jgi:hypothetical protein
MTRLFNSAGPEVCLPTGVTGPTFFGNSHIFWEFPKKIYLGSAALLHRESVTGDVSSIVTGVKRLVMSLHI